jgi:hypothetical protein
VFSKITSIIYCLFNLNEKYNSRSQTPSLVAVLFILIINYLFLFSSGGKDEPMTRGDTFVIIAIDAILGGVFYWLHDAMTQEFDDADKK